MSGNPCLRTRDVDDPYEIWEAAGSQGPWTWRVLKKYQNPENEAKNHNALWHTAAKSPMTRGSWEYGDEYVRRIKRIAICIYKEDLP